MSVLLSLCRLHRANASQPVYLFDLRGKKKKGGEERGGKGSAYSNEARCLRSLSVAALQLNFLILPFSPSSGTGSPQGAKKRKGKEKGGERKKGSEGRKTPAKAAMTSSFLSPFCSARQRKKRKGEKEQRRCRPTQLEPALPMLNSFFDPGQECQGQSAWFDMWGEKEGTR